MTLEKTIFAVLILTCFGFAAVTWEESRSDRASLEKAIEIQQQVIDAADTRENSRDASLKITLSQMAAANRTVQTPQQIVNALEQFLELPKPISLDTKPAIVQPGKGRRKQKFGNPSKNPAVPTAPESRQDTDHVQLSQSGSPDAKATECCERPPVAPKPSVSKTPTLKSEILNVFTGEAHPRANLTTPQIDDSTPAARDANPSLNPIDGASMPSADLKPLFEKVQSCQSCKAQLAVAQSDLEDEKTRSASLRKERDLALSSAKGGTFWHRLKQNAKWLVIGAALGAVACGIR